MRWYLKLLSLRVNTQSSWHVSYSLEFTGGSLVPFFEWPFSAKSKLVETIVSTAVLAVTLKYNK